MQSNPGGTGTNDRTTGRHRLRRRLRLGGFVVALAVAIYLISGFFDVFELVHSWSRKYEGADVDELIVVAAFSPALILLYFLLLERGGRLSYFGGRRIRTEIITATPHLVAITNEDGGLVYLNPAGRRLHGIPDGEDGLPQNLQLFAEESRTQISEEAIPRARADGVWTGYCTRLTEDGREIPTAEVIICHRDRAGRVANYSFLSRDLSERQAYEHRLRHKQRLESVGQLAGGIAHQFNNLLMIIMGYASRAKKAQDVAAVRDNLEKVLSAAETAAGMTRELLLFARAEGGGSAQVVSASEEIGSMMTLFRPLVGERCRLQLSINHEDTWVEADPDNLTQVIMNLVTNARDAMPDGGAIEVSVDWHTGSPDRQPIVGRLTDSVYVMISIRDEGRGMTRETMERIFEPFYTTKDAGKGTGLGLPVVLGFVEMCGGALDVESEPGRGTTFRLFLPAAQRIKEAEDLPDDDLRGSDGATILLVDDQDQLRSLLRESLMELGYNVLTARDGETAMEIEASFRGRIDLLLTDIMMPEMNGIELAAELCRRNPSLKAVFITGYPGEAKNLSVKPPEGAVILQKPVDPDLLARTLTNALSATPAEYARAS